MQDNHLAFASVSQNNQQLITDCYARSTSQNIFSKDKKYYFARLRENI